MARIKGINVTLYERKETGRDGFGSPTYTETPVVVENVLIEPTAASEVISEMQLYGKRSEYQLCIPKGDIHIWEGCEVSFDLPSGTFRGRVFGSPQEWIESMIPLSWNKKVKVERYG